MLSMFCEKCGVEFSKPPSCSKKNWVKRRFCSVKCRKNDEKECLTCGKVFRPRGERKHTAQWCSISCSKKGKVPPNLRIAQAASPITKKGNPSHLKGKKRNMSEQWYANMEKSHHKRGLKGEKHWNWKGGVTPINAALRHSHEYTVWRKSVYVKDNWECQECGAHCKAKNIVAHHIKPFHDYPGLRYDIDNGITYCRACHASLHQKLRRSA